MAKIEAETGEKGEWLPSKDEIRLPKVTKIQEDSLDLLFVLFLTEEAWGHGGLRARELGQTPLVLVWLTNVSTIPILYIIPSPPPEGITSIQYVR